jgi:hypothetical protein
MENPSILLASEVYADDGTPMGKYYKIKVIEPALSITISPPT